MLKSVVASPKHSEHTWIGGAVLAVLFAAAAGLLTFVAAYNTSLLPVVTMAFVAVLLAVLNRLVALTACMVLAGFVQAPLAGVTELPSVLWIDDIFLVAGIVGALYRILLYRRWKMLTFSAMSFGFLALGVVRSVTAERGIYQARQIIVPIVLIMIGALLRRDELRRITNFAFPLGLVTAIYVVIEMAGIHLVDPWLGVTLNDLKSVADYAFTREFPLNYYYFYGNASDLYFERSGGLFLNPPGVGLFVAGIGLMVQGFGSKRQKFAAPFMTAVTVVGSVGRASAVVFLLGLGQATIVRKLTRVGLVLIATVAAFALLNLFSDQGNSSAHASGFVDGLLTAIKNPIGLGFGRVGNVADHAEESFGESLLGMFVASLGWPALGAVGLAVVVALRNPDRIQNIALTAAVLTSALSETLSGLAFVAPLWILAGNAWSSEASIPRSLPAGKTSA
jgi:hypothetical protein